MDGVEPDLNATPAPLWAFALAGLPQGVAYLHPWLWWGAWLSVASVAGLIAREPRRRRRAAGVGLMLAVAHVVGFFWTPGMHATMLSVSWPVAALYGAGTWALFIVPMALVVMAVAAVVPTRAPVALWLPLAWVVGETLRLDVTRLDVTDWLMTQWSTRLVLEMVGALGWYPALIGCLVMACGVGEAVARRRRWDLVVPAALLVGAVCLPPLSKGDPEMLRGVAVVHTQSTLAMPHRAPELDLELVVWPEAIFDFRPPLAEGPAEGPELGLFLPGSEADHVVGLWTMLPMVGSQNQAVVVDAGGQVRFSRAKRALMRVGEQSFWGLGRDYFRPGRLPPLLQVGDRKLVAVICGEASDRRIVKEGCALGGDLIVIPARDVIMPGTVPLRQLIASQVLRSVEFGRPSVRSSLEGWSSIVGADGTVLALSTGERNHLLTWSPERGPQRFDFEGRLFVEGEAAPPVPEPRVAVLYSELAPQLRTRCPEGRCVYIPLERPTCPEAPIDTVVVAGHARPPDYLSVTPEALADAVACFEPELVVVDACYGGSTPIAAALAERLPTRDGERPLFVGAPSLVPMSGFRYDAAFFESSDAWERARAVSLAHAPVWSLSLDADVLSEAIAAVESLDSDALREHLVRRNPYQVRVVLPTGAELVMPVDWQRVRPTGQTRPTTP